MHGPGADAPLTAEELAFARALERGIQISAAHWHEQPSDVRAVNVQTWRDRDPRLQFIELYFKAKDALAPLLRTRR